MPRRLLRTRRRTGTRRTTIRRRHPIRRPTRIRRIVTQAPRAIRRTRIRRTTQMCRSLIRRRLRRPRKGTRHRILIRSSHRRIRRQDSIPRRIPKARRARIPRTLNQRRKCRRRPMAIHRPNGRGRRLEADGSSGDSSVGWRVRPVRGACRWYRCVRRLRHDHYVHRSPFRPRPVPQSHQGPARAFAS